MKIHIIGASALNPIGEDIIQKHASVRIICNRQILQIDAGNIFEGRADYLLISHLHSDHIDGISTVPENVRIFVPSVMFQKFFSI